MASSMYTIAKGVIEQQRFELSDMLAEIDTEWVLSALTSEEREELVALARSKADPMGALPGVSERLGALEVEMDSLQARVAALESAQGGEQEGGGGEQGGGEPEPEPSDEYPAWHDPSGQHDCYYTGMKMTYKDGKRYVCIAPKNYGVTYGPDVLPQMWQLVEEE